MLSMPRGFEVASAHGSTWEFCVTNRLLSCESPVLLKAAFNEQSCEYRQQACRKAPSVS